MYVHDRRVNVLSPEKDGSGSIAKDVELVAYAKELPVFHMFQDVYFPPKTEK